MCMFTENRKIRYTQLSANQTMRLADVLNFFQDAAVAHTTACGHPLQSLYAQNSAWILLAIRVVLDSQILAEEVEVSTWPYLFSKASCNRAFSIKSPKDGRTLVDAASIWAYVDTVSGRPKEVPPAYVSMFKSIGKTPSLSCERRPTMALPETLVSSFRVLKRDIDTNKHMNNVKYLEYAEEVLPEDFQVKEFKIHFRHAAYLGDKLFLYGMQNAEKGCVNAIFKNEAGEICTYIQFSSQPESEKGI